MKQEFATVRGKVIIGEDHLRVSNLIPARNNDIYWMSFQAILCFYMLQKKSPADILGYIGLSLVGIFALVSLIEFIFIKVWRNRFSLDEIRTYAVRPDHTGLETIVTLVLKNGKKKDIPFRTRENQYEAFLQLISQHSLRNIFA